MSAFDGYRCDRPPTSHMQKHRAILQVGDDYRVWDRDLHSLDKRSRFIRRSYPQLCARFGIASRRKQFFPHTNGSTSTGPLQAQTIADGCRSIFHRIQRRGHALPPASGPPVKNSQPGPSAEIIYAAHRNGNAIPGNRLRPRSHRRVYARKFGMHNAVRGIPGRSPVVPCIQGRRAKFGALS